MFRRAISRRAIQSDLQGIKGIQVLDKLLVYKRLLDEVFVISGILKVEVSVINRSRRLRLITLTEILIIPDITKTESNNKLFYYTLF